jgi:hypothetical protein
MTGMDEEDRWTLEQDEYPLAHMAALKAIQEVLDDVQREMSGGSVEDVAVVIDRRLAAAGFPEQPHRWVHVMAERISAGLPPVADTRAAVDAVRLAESGPLPAEPESVEPGAVVEGQATPPAEPR